MNRILYSLVRLKLASDVLIAQDTHIVWKMLAVGAEQTTVERYRRQEGQRDWLEAGGLGTDRAGHGKEPMECSHDGIVWSSIV